MVFTKCFFWDVFTENETQYPLIIRSVEQKILKGVWSYPNKKLIYARFDKSWFDKSDGQVHN